MQRAGATPPESDSSAHDDPYGVRGETSSHFHIGMLGLYPLLRGFHKEMFVHAVDDDTTLSMVEMRDADEIFALVEASRMYLREWLPWVDAASSVEDSKAFARASHKQYADGDGFQCCIRYRGKIAGIIGFSRVDWLNKRVEIGYWLDEELQGRGIMTACCRVLVEFAFTEYALHRVEIRVASENQKSRAIPERLGFTCEGTLREAEWLNDHFVDIAVSSMLRRDWKRQR